MGISRSKLSDAANKFADTEQRLGKWEVWPKYEVRQGRESERYVLRVEPSEADLPPRVDLSRALEKTKGRVAPGSSEEALMAQAMERTKARKEVWSYHPLVKEPDLFLQFARLADADGLDGASTKEELDTEKNAAVAEEWAHDYGVLGLTLFEKDGQRGASTVGGKKETVAAFAQEAWVANGCLRLYEAATSNELNVDLITSYISSPRWRAFYAYTPSSAREWALNEVATQTQHRVAGNAYPALYGEVGRFVQGWDFVNLLGAMWLQMFWLLTVSDTPRRCKNWECDKIIAYEQPQQPTTFAGKNDRSRGYRTRGDKGFCSKKCSNRYNYLTRTKPRRRTASEI